VNNRVELTKLDRAFGVLLVLALGFIAGTRSDELYRALAPAVGVKVDDKLNLSDVEFTYSQLISHFNGKLDRDKLLEGASRGLIEAANDPYTIYMSAKEAKEFEKDLSGDIGGGIGAEIGIRKGQPTVIRTLPENPAQKAGRRAGDVIIAVNDEVTIDWDADSTVKVIRGEIGTTVKVTVRRGNETKKFSITRAEVNNPSVQSKIQNGVGILTVTRFDNDTSDLTRRAAEKFVSKRVKAVVLDLRGNGGGFLDAAPRVAGLWLDDKVVVTTHNNTSDQELRAEGDPILKNIPTAVLVNGSTASAAEIVAGAMKDYNAAQLIGERTFGKGTVQEIVPLRNGAQLKVTITRWFTPKGNNITKSGIKPNISVDLTQKNFDNTRDPQLERALKELAV